MRYQAKTHGDKDIRALELKVDQFDSVLQAMTVADMLMRSADLIYEIRFLLRVHQWSETYWKHHRLTGMIEHVERITTREQKRRVDNEKQEPEKPKRRILSKEDHEFRTLINTWGFLFFLMSAIALGVGATHIKATNAKIQATKYMNSSGFFYDSQGTCYTWEKGNKRFPGNQACREASNR